MATLAQLNTEVNKWTNSLRKVTAEYNNAHNAIYGYECGHPYDKREHERLLMANYDIVLVRRKLAEAQAALKTFKENAEREKAKADYETMWKHEPTLWEAYVKK